MRIRFGTEVFEIHTRDRDINEDLLNHATEVVLPMNRATEDFVDWLLQNELADELPESKLNPSIEQADEMDQLLASPISVIIDEMRRRDITHSKATRIHNCLRNAGFKCVYEIVMQDEIDLGKTKGFGELSQSLLKEALANLGLRVGMVMTPERLKRIKALINA